VNRRKAKKKSIEGILHQGQTGENIEVNQGQRHEKRAFPAKKKAHPLGGRITRSKKKKRRGGGGERLAQKMRPGGRTGRPKKEIFGEDRGPECASEQKTFTSGLNREGEKEGGTPQPGNRSSERRPNHQMTELRGRELKRKNFVVQKRESF